VSLTDDDALLARLESIEAFKSRALFSAVYYCTVPRLLVVIISRAFQAVVMTDLLAGLVFHPQTKHLSFSFVFALETVTESVRKVD